MSSGKPTSLGSRTRSFMPMTPRSLKPNNEQRNIRTKSGTGYNESNHTSDDQPPFKKFKSNAAPKGTKLAAGYVDRVQQRLKEQDDVNSGEDKHKRLQALEEMLKLQQIDQAMFESLRDEIGIGGNLESTHLVKGLDFKLLERARRGEDINKAASAGEEKEETPQIDVEAELEKELEKGPELPRDSAKSKNTHKTEPEDETSSAAPTASLSRDELLRRLKQNRKNPNLLASESASVPAEPEPQSNLDLSRFRKLESTSKSNKRKFTETVNGRRREVLVITDKDGKTKRKTRWLDPEPDPSTGAKTNDPNNVAWGGDLPAEVLAQQKAAAEKAAQQGDDEDGDDDIFGGVKEYDPLADIDSDEETHLEAQATEEPKADDNYHAKSAESARTGGLKSTFQTRNYFTATAETDNAESKDVAHDPAILAALKRAAQIRRQEEAEADSPGEGEGEDADRKPSISNNDDDSRNRALLKKLQQQSHQDDLDIDMGFGGDTKYDDDDDEGEEGGESGRRQKLSEWKGADGYRGDDDDEEDGKKAAGGSAKRKRGGKKKKGDKNSLADVMSVLERRKAT